jgi:Ca2+-binding EF-hand superfamily protein
MAEKFSSRFKKVKDAFVKMDIDCTGLISADEFKFTCEFPPVAACTVSSPRMAIQRTAELNSRRLGTNAIW